MSTTKHFFTPCSKAILFRLLGCSLDVPQSAFEVIPFMVNTLMLRVHPEHTTVSNGYVLRGSKTPLYDLWKCSFAPLTMFRSLF